MVTNCSFLTLYSVFFIKEKVIIFLFIHREEEFHHRKFPSILIFCSNKATNTSIFLLRESTWKFYKAQFVAVPKCCWSICGDSTAFTVVTQLQHSRHFNYLGKNKCLPLIKHSESAVFIEGLIVRVHCNSFRYPTCQCMEINILKCKYSKEIRTDNPYTHNCTQLIKHLERNQVHISYKYSSTHKRVKIRTNKQKILWLDKDNISK